MSVSSLSSSYAGSHEEWMNSYKSRYVPSFTSTGGAGKTGKVSDFYEMYDENTLKRIEQNGCTDDVDDGKIGFWSKVGNVVQGVFKGAVDMVKGALKHPFKTIAAIAISCIPVVGPAFMIGMGAYGVISGGMQIAKNWQIANQIEKNGGTDAEVKAAWENVGSGALTVGTSVLAIKGGAGMLKSQLTKPVLDGKSSLGQSGSKTVEAIRNAKASGKTAGEITEIAFREGFKETAVNGVNVAKTIGSKGKTAWGKFKQYKNNPSSIVDDIANLGGGIGKKVGDGINKANDWRKSHLTKAGRAQSTQTAINSGAKVDMTGLKHGEIPQGAVKLKNGSGFTIKKNGVETTYNMNGVRVKTVDSKGVITTYKANGSVPKATIRKSVTELSDGSTEYRTTTTKEGKLFGKGVKTETVKIEEYGCGETIGKGTIKTVSRGNSSYTTGKTGSTYQYNGTTLENPTMLQKAGIRIDASRTGQFIDAELFGLGNQTNPFLYKVSSPFIFEEK